MSQDNLKSKAELSFVLSANSCRENETQKANLSWEKLTIPLLISNFHLFTMSLKIVINETKKMGWSKQENTSYSTKINLLIYFLYKTINWFKV